MATTLPLPPGPITWHFLAQSIEATGAISPYLVRAMAAERAGREVEIYRAMGWVRKFENVLAEETLLVEMQAKADLDYVVAMKLRAALPAHEQAARTLDLGAELARSAIPPRPAEALTMACRADAVRRAQPLMAAE